MNAVSEKIYGTVIQEIDYDDEPPLNDDEIRGLEIADREIAEGKAIPFSEVFGDLWGGVRD
ncbi:MAG: hypothetical protein IJU07_06530 [Synergistaceae bacterium]|nr:hypothetical protein [Synergistaceae bacterium]